MQVEFGHSLVTFSDDMDIFVPLESTHKLTTNIGCDRFLAKIKNKREMAQKGELLLALPIISIPPKRLLESATLKPLANFSEFLLKSDA